MPTNDERSPVGPTSIKVVLQGQSIFHATPPHPRSVPSFLPLSRAVPDATRARSLLREAPIRLAEASPAEARRHKRGARPGGRWRRLSTGARSVFSGVSTCVKDLRGVAAAAGHGTGGIVEGCWVGYVHVEHLNRRSSWGSGNKRQSPQGVARKLAGCSLKYPGVGQTSGAGSARDRRFRLHRIKTRRLHRCSSKSKLCEADSKQLRFPPQLLTSGPFSRPLCSKVDTFVANSLLS